MVQALRKLEEYIENNEVNFYNSVNLRYHQANVLSLLKKEFQDNGFSEQFNFKLHLHDYEASNNKSDLLNSLINNMVQDISSQIQKPSSIADYWNQMARLVYFDEYTEEGNNMELIEMLKNTEEFKAMEKIYNESSVVAFDEDDV